MGQPLTDVPILFTSLVKIVSGAFSEEMMDHFGSVALKWDPKNLEIRTMSVEKTLEPLVLQVSSYFPLTPAY